MESRQAKKPNKKHRNRVDVMELYLNGNTGFTRSEFYSLLQRTEIVASIIDIHDRDLVESKRRRNEHNSSETLLELEDSHWKTFTEKYLADWLFKITDILTMQAKFASRGYPMSHAQLTALIYDAFLKGENRALRLKDGRNEIWSAATLKSAINTALPEIKTSGAVTLTNLAKKINAHSMELLFGRAKTRLSGKHLQKLFKKHDIDWIGIKKSYKRRLLVETMLRNEAR